MHTLTLVEGPGAPKTFVLELRVTLVGRGDGNDIVLDGRKVSKRHALFAVRNDDTVQVEDLNSRNGLYVDDRKAMESILKPGASVRVGDCKFLYAIVQTQTRGSDSSIPSMPEIETGYRVFYTDVEGNFDVVPLKTECIYLGKGEDNDLVLQGPDVSRRHAMLCLSRGRWQLHDLESTNGTYVNGKPIEQAEVNAGDRIRIGGFLLTLEGETKPISRDDLISDAQKQLRKRHAYLAWSTQVRLLVIVLGAVALLAVAVIVKLLGGF